ncbi:hypothetical protein [Schumannella soli]|uniref:Uncharacterized protein n=1 Tax=Schumannella soli TaxID=2590779 RepID=A0A506Y076_9MICO|nr:hypothetical protein [Schumannella soli]TPW75392.1 hypothetical protein FJ657_05675 [Schumannella soli]
MLRAIQRLMVVAGVMALLYAFFTTGSHGGCSSATPGDAGAGGAASPAAERCLQLTMGPSPIVLVVLAALVLFAIGRVRRRAADQLVALVILNRFTIVVAVVAAASALIAAAWFWSLPLEVDAHGAYSLWLPFPFASVNVDSSPVADLPG